MCENEEYLKSEELNPTQGCLSDVFFFQAALLVRVNINISKPAILNFFWKNSRIRGKFRIEPIFFVD